MGEKGTAECSDKTQTILVKAMEHDYDNKISDASVLLDFKNHNFVVKNSQEKKIFDKMTYGKRMKSSTQVPGNLAVKCFSIIKAV